MNLLDRLKSSAFGNRALHVRQYRLIVEKGSAASEGDVEQLRKIVAELGKTEADIEADQRILNEHALLTAKAATLDREEAEHKDAREAYDAKQPALAKQIAALNAELSALADARANAKYKEFLAFQAQTDLRNLKNKHYELLGD